MVELGQIDITLHVSMMSRYMACPRHGHLKHVLQIVAYLKGHLNSQLVLDPISCDWSEMDWVSADWSEFYPEAEEVIPPNVPAPHGKPVQINVFMDAAHVMDLVTRWLVTGILIFLMGALIRWYSKRQNTIESSTFRSEFVAAKIAVEMVEGLCYKLQMMGVPLDGPANCFCDSNSVVLNVTNLVSTLKKKHNSVAYHKV